jgi:hypothetical protein
MGIVKKQTSRIETHENSRIRMLVNSIYMFIEEPWTELLGVG